MKDRIVLNMIKNEKIVRLQEITVNEASYLIQQCDNLKSLLKLVIANSK